MNKTTAIILAVVVVVVGGIIIFNNKSAPSEGTAGLVPSGETMAPPPPSTAPTQTIHITANGFDPKTVTLTKGAVVTFVNDDTRDHWPATGIHPTHTVYPGSDIKKCGTSEQSMIFDACRGLKTGESFTFTFNEVGTWRYHDHLHATLNGTIVITE